MIIGLHGFAGVGKDTVAEHLVHQHGFEHRKFAEPLKQSVANLFNITREQVDEFKYSEGEIPGVEVLVDIYGKTQYSFSWREFLQRYGTEAHRDVFGQNFWVDQCLPIQDAFVEQDIVVSDTRFMSEMDRIKILGGIVVNIYRPGYVSGDHSSEMDHSEYADYHIHNEGSVIALCVKVDNLIDHMTRKATGATLSPSEQPTLPQTRLSDSDAAAAQGWPYRGLSE